VDALRGCGYVSVLLVAEQSEQVVAHILFRDLPNITDAGTVRALALAPMAVLPEFQNQGIGSAFVRRGPKRATSGSITYNYGNVLSALGEYEAARDEFLEAINLDKNQAMVWKNLAYAWACLGNHKEEAKCLAAALRIDPSLPEALVSEGVRLIVCANQPGEGATLIERAISVDGSFPVRWPHVYYWLGKAYHALGKRQTALQRIDLGLTIAPHHLGLLDMKAHVLSVAWRQDKAFLPPARTFFRFVVEASPGNYRAIEELARIESAADGDGAGWGVIDGYVALPNGDAASTYFNMVEYPLEDVLIGLRFLKAYTPFRQQSKIYGFVEELEQHSIAGDDTFRNALFLVLAVSFGP
jgi:tetratricopeptide (TPR) repeat protein